MKKISNPPPPSGVRPSPPPPPPISPLHGHLSEMSAELEAYHKLHDGLSNMIEGGRLTVDDIPDDYHWLVETLAALAVR